MRKTEIAIILSKYALGFQNFDLSEERIGYYFSQFETSKAEDFDKALRAACNERGRVFFPTIGEIRTYLSPIESPPTLDSMMTTDEAYALALKIASGIASKEFTKKQAEEMFSLRELPTLCATMRTVGFHKLLRVYAPYSAFRTGMTTEECKWLEVEFKRTFKSLKEKENVRSAHEMLEIDSKVKILIQEIN